MSWTIGTSNASDTWSSWTTGTIGSRDADEVLPFGDSSCASAASSERIARRTAAGCRLDALAARLGSSTIRQHRQQQLRDEVVDDEDQYARRHDRLCRAMADTFCSTRRAEAVIAC